MEFEIKMDFDLYTGIISYNMTSHFKHRIQPLCCKKHRYVQPTENPSPEDREG
ncbi:unnamed protein product [Bubo scandiacus]